MLAAIFLAAGIIALFAGCAYSDITASYRKERPLVVTLAFGGLAISILGALWMNADAYSAGAIAHFEGRVEVVITLTPSKVVVPVPGATP